jgi:DNA-directed RNA polymerase specialized sigma24 family protein
MGLQDGFGDDRRDIDYQEYILANEPLLKLKAADRLRTDESARDVWDDVLQEGRIVQWEVLQKRPDAPSAYVSAAMSNRMSRAISARQWTGAPTAQGRPRDPGRRPGTASVDDETTQVVELPTSSAWLEQVLISYHRGEIMQALAALTLMQKDYVVRRFWGGYTNAEIAAERGISKGEVERQWRVNIRPQLLEHLRHLASA